MTGLAETLLDLKRQIRKVEDGLTADKAVLQKLKQELKSDLKLDSVEAARAESKKLKKQGRELQDKCEKLGKKIKRKLDK